MFRPWMNSSSMAYKPCAKNPRRRKQLRRPRESPARISPTSSLSHLSRVQRSIWKDSGTTGGRLTCERVSSRNQRPLVRDWLRSTDPDLLWASVVSFGEIRKGIERLAAGQRRAELEEWVARELDQWFEERLLPVTKAVAERWGVLSARALDKGTPLPNNDGLIAATAIEHDLTLVTRNVRDFVGLEVTIVNPWEA